MRAKIKATGEIMKLADYARIVLDACDSYGNPIELSPEEVELIPDLEPKRLYVQEDNFPNIDWEQRRYEIAKSAMQGILANSHESDYRCGYKGSVKFPPKGVAEWAVEYADALIAELKKERKDNE